MLLPVTTLVFPACVTDTVQLLHHKLLPVVQTDIGLLTACFQVAGDRSSVMQLRQPMGIQVCKEFDCPLLTMAD